MTKSREERQQKLRSRRSPNKGRERRIVVEAPKSLPEGYLFDVLVDGKPVTVAVPRGGVREGEEFEVPYPDTSQFSGDESSSIAEKPTEDESVLNDNDTATEMGNAYAEREDDDDEDEDESKMAARHAGQERDALGAPYGRWRYPLCACCDVVTQATFWMALCCIPVLLAQLVTRVKLNWKGKKDSAQEVSLSYNKIILAFITALALGNLPVVGMFVMVLYVLGLLVWTGRNLRSTIRKRYKIPSSSCLPEPMDDCCCMVLCCCCASIQMSRQTHNDKEYPGSCCTPTGLDQDAPEMV